MNKALRLRLLTWTIASLTVVNFLLVVVFIGVLLSGSLTEGITKYIAERHLYAPPTVAVPVSLWPLLWGGVKWLVKRHLPDQGQQNRFFQATLAPLRKLASRWRPAAGIVAVL